MGVDGIAGARSGGWRSRVTGAQDDLERAVAIAGVITREVRRGGVAGEHVARLVAGGRGGGLDELDPLWADGEADARLNLLGVAARWVPVDPQRGAKTTCGFIDVPDDHGHPGDARRAVAVRRRLRVVRHPE